MIKRMSDARLEAESIVKRFDGVAALDGLSVSFPKQGVCAVVGPNGAGKTTLLDVLTGFQAPDSGRVTLGGRDITSRASHVIARSGLARTFQEVRLIRQESVLNNVLLAQPEQHGETVFGALVGSHWPHRESARQAGREQLRFVGLADEAETFAGELSYGQQKLLTLAACMATRAPILFLDEPVAGVHPELAEQLAGLIRDIGRQGRLVVFIEHNLPFVRAVSDEVMVMSGGQIVAHGDPMEVLDRDDVMEVFFG